MLNSANNYLCLTIKSPRGWELSENILPRGGDFWKKSCPTPGEFDPRPGGWVPKRIEGSIMLIKKHVIPGREGMILL